MLTYERLNHILDTIEPQLHSLVARYGLANVAIERWRWDFPSIVLTWLDQRNINKNMQAWISQEVPRNLLQVDVHAWIDEGNIRRWNHSRLTERSIDIPTQGDAWARYLPDTLADAYNIVDRWGEETLTMEQVIPSSTFAVVGTLQHES